MKYGFMDENRSAFPVGKMCRALQIARSGYYQWRTSAPSSREQENRKLTEEIREIHEGSWKIYGSPRIYRELAERGVAVSENRVVRLMKKAGIRSRVKRKYRATTDSRHSLPIAPNLLERKFEAQAPNEVWTGDITYIWTWEGWLYLAVVIDLFSRKIVGFRVHDREAMELSAPLLAEICEKENIVDGQLTVHADNGGSMKGATMLATMEKLGIEKSFSRPSVSDDNPFSESLFKTLKYCPIFPTKPFESVEAAQAWVVKFVYWYNEVHLHSAISFVTPSSRHSGLDVETLNHREIVYAEAKRKNPNRWSNKTRNWERVATVNLNCLKEKEMRATDVAVA